MGRRYGKTSISGGGASDPVPSTPGKQRQNVISSEIEIDANTIPAAKAPMDKETPPS
jgi:hypothetical protein